MQGCPDEGVAWPLGVSVADFWSDIIKCRLSGCLAFLAATSGAVATATLEQLWADEQSVIDTAAAASRSRRSCVAGALSSVVPPKCGDVSCLHADAQAFASIPISTGPFVS